MAGLLPDRPELITATLDLARECAFTLDLVAPDLPGFPTPAGHTEMTWLAEVTRSGRASIRIPAG